MEGRSVREMVEGLLKEGSMHKDASGDEFGIKTGTKSDMKLRPGEIGIDLQEITHVKPIGMVIARGVDNDGETRYFRFFNEKEGLIAKAALELMNQIRSIVESNGKNSGSCGAMVGTPDHSLMTKEQYDILKVLAA